VAHSVAARIAGACVTAQNTRLDLLIGAAVQVLEQGASGGEREGSRGQQPRGES
jgi:hypothetical protein